MIATAGDLFLLMPIAISIVKGRHGQPLLAPLTAAGQDTMQAMEEIMVQENQTTRIVRVWRGSTATSRADDYEAYLYAEGLPDLKKHAVGVLMLRRDRTNESDFVVMSFWKDIPSMSSFAGSDPEKIRHLERDEEFLTFLPEAVEIFEVKASTLPAPLTLAYSVN